jgi:hypothetical protein
MKSTQNARFYSARLLAMAVLLGIMAGSAVDTYAANTERSVQGKVVTGSDTPVSSAIVYLSDTRTMAVESYITQQDGGYRFEQLSPNDDYKLWAQLDGKKSKTKILSSFDDRSTFHVILKIGSGK